MHSSSRSRSPYPTGILLLLLSFLVGSLACAQTIQVTDYQGNAVASGGAVYIDPNVGQWPMPTITITVNDTCTQESVAVDLNLSYTDPYSDSTSYGHISWDTGTNNTQTGVPWTVNWASYGFVNVLSEGGDATVTARLGSGKVVTFSFYVLGHDVPEYPQPNLVDQYYESSGVNAPWFWGSLLALESSGGHQYNSSGSPNTTPTPDGIGIAQLDGTQNPTYAQDCVYWNYKCNIDINLDILNGKGSESQNNWTSNYAASGNTDPSPYDSKNPYPYCDFITSTVSLGNHSFGDANWIQDYNTHSGGSVNPDGQLYYLWWNGSGWQFRWRYSSLPGYNYVPSVCTSAPY